MWKEFREFIMRGNVLDLAVAVIIAGAFGAIVTSFTDDVLMPPIGMLLGGVDFSDLALVLKPAVTNDAGEVVTEAVAIRYGVFLQRVLDFLIIAFAVFMIVRTYNHLTSLRKKKEEEPAPDPGPSEKEILLQIRDLLRDRQV